MKHLSHKLAVSLLATGVTLSSVNADLPLLEMPSVVSSDSTAMTTHPAYKAQKQPKNDNTALTTHPAYKAPKQLNNAESIITSLRYGEAQLEKALLSGAAAQDELIELTKSHNKLLSEFNALSEENKKLILEIALLKAQQEEHRSEKQSTWQSFKDWIRKPEVIKVVSTVIAGLISVIGTLLVIIL